MSVTINPAVNSGYGSDCGVSRTPRLAQPVEVWDLNPGRDRSGVYSGVRTLDVIDRKGERTENLGYGRRDYVSEGFESHREGKEGFVLAALLTGALLAGSAFGGVFSDADQVPGSSQPVFIADSEAVR